MSRPRKRKPRSGEGDGPDNVSTDEGVATSTADETTLSQDDQDVVRAVDEVADAIVARVLAVHSIGRRR